MLIRASALGGIAVVFGEYLLRSLGVDPVEHYVAARALSAAAIAFAACANIVGANVGAAIVGVSTAAKFSALVRAGRRLVRCSAAATAPASRI